MSPGMQTGNMFTEIAPQSSPCPSGVATVMHQCRQKPDGSQKLPQESKAETRLSNQTLPKLFPLPANCLRAKARNNAQTPPGTVRPEILSGVTDVAAATV